MRISTLRVVLVENEGVDSSLLKQKLQAPSDLPVTFTLTAVTDAQTAQKTLRSVSADVILLPLVAQVESHLADYVQLTSGIVPLIVVAATEAQALHAASIGVLDYVLPEQMSPRMIGRLITATVDNFQMQREINYLHDELALSERRFRTIAMAGIDGLLIVGSDGLIRFANAAAERLLGRGIESLIGFPTELPLLLHQVTTITLPAAPVPDDGSSASGTNGATESPTVIEIRTVETQWENAAAALLILRDITDQRRSDYALRTVINANNRFFTALSTLTSGVFITDPNLPENPMIYVNPACLHMTGYTRDEVLGHPISIFYGPETDGTTIQRISDKLRQREQFYGVVLNYRKDGQAFWSELTLNPVFDERDHLVNFIGVQADVTERVEWMELHQQRRRMEKLVTEISSEFVNLSYDQIDPAVTRVMQRLGRFVGVDRCTVSQVAESEEAFNATHEWRADGVPSLLSVGSALGFSEVPWFYDQLQRFEPVLTPNVDLMPLEAAPERERLQRSKIKALLAVPISRDNRLVGYLGFASLRQPKDWSMADLSLLKLIGEIIFGALHRKYTMYALRSSEERFRLVVSSTPMVMFSFDIQGQVTFVEGKALETLKLAPIIQVGQSIDDIFGGSPEVVNYCERALTGESLLATLRLDSLPDLVFEAWFTPVRGPNESIVGGNGVAWDISERYRAELAEREQRVLAEALRDTANALTRSLDPDTVLNEILNNASRVVPHVSSSIILVSPGSTQMRSVVHARGFSREITTTGSFPARVSLDMPTFRYMRETGRPCLVPDVSQFTGWQVFKGMEHIRSYLGVPIIAFEELVGFLNLDSDMPNFFTPIHAERLKAFADQAAIAIQNAQLYDQVRRDAHQLVLLNKATAFLHTSLLTTGNQQELSQQVAEVVAREFGKLDCSVILRGDDGTLHRMTRAGQYQATFADMPIDDTLILQVVEGGEAMYVPDTVRDLYYQQGDSRTRARFVVPLRTAQRVIGALDLHSMEPNAFPEGDRQTLISFSERIANALENTKLYRQVLSHNEELDRRVKQRTQDLAQERARLDTILNSMYEALLSWELDGGTVRIRYVNKAFTQMFKYSELEAVGVPNFYQKLLPSRESRQRLAHVFTEGINRVGFSRLETQVRRADGSTFEAQFTITRLTDQFPALHSLEGEQQTSAGVLLIRDISQEKALQAQKDRFIANASHELRTPLANLKLRTYLLAKQPGRVDDHIAVMQQVVDRMHYLMEDLLDITRFEQGRITLNRANTSLQHLIQDVVDIETVQANEKSISLGTDLPPTPVVMQIDANRLRQVLTNLVINAINYTPVGGQVTVVLDVDADQGSPVAHIRIKDTGIGIAPELLERIFEPFVRANDGTTRGTGLGLTIAKEIVTLHNGTISVQSVERVGTTFTISLPMRVASQ
jgi:PAS domain S-box-containing protein